MTRLNDSARVTAGSHPDWGVVTMPLEVELPRDDRAAARARRLVADLVHAELGAEELDRARLLVSELVTNAVVHGRGAITLRVGLDESRVLIEVIDEGSGFEPAIRQRDLIQPGGWGLRIVDAEANRWGVHDETTHVWCEIARQDSPRPDDKPSAPHPARR